MTDRRLAVVIPFGVPAAGQGLGIGLAALVQACLHVDGAGVGIAQLHMRKPGESGGAPPSPMEAFVPPAAWLEIAGRGGAPAGVDLVLTGSFRPPGDGAGTIQLLAFEARSGRAQMQVEAPVDDEQAGATLAGALEKLGAGMGGHVGGLLGIRELPWEPLESVLRAERCALHDPSRGEPFDRMAAMAHLERAIGDAPDARYPVERLAGIALETAAGAGSETPLVAAAMRVLERASRDAPGQVDLIEALATIHLRFGRGRAAERAMAPIVAAAPSRARPYVLLAHALRLDGDTDRSLAVLDAGFAQAVADAGLYAERGLVLGARGDLDGAAGAWREALARDPVHPVAFENMAAVVLRTRDALAAQALVDAALSSPRVELDVLRRAIGLSLASEPEGLARASRVSCLCARILERAPDDAGALVAVARASLGLGERQEALARLNQLSRVAPGSVAAADAQMLRFAIENPALEMDLRSVLRAANAAAPEDLPGIAARGRRLGTLHGAWVGWMAAAVAERRREHWAAARDALAMALGETPGAVTAHGEMVEVLLALKDYGQAVFHAERVLALEGESPRALGTLARALSAAGRSADAAEAVRRVRGLHGARGPRGPRDEPAPPGAVRRPAQRERAPASWWRIVRDRLRGPVQTATPRALRKIRKI